MKNLMMTLFLSLIVSSAFAGGSGVCKVESPREMIYSLNETIVVDVTLECQSPEKTICIQYAEGYGIFENLRDGEVVKKTPFEYKYVTHTDEYAKKEHGTVNYAALRTDLDFFYPLKKVLKNYNCFGTGEKSTCEFFQYDSRSQELVFLVTKGDAEKTPISRIQYSCTRLN